jgi:Domain of unknown function (DUF4189)
MPNMRHVNGLLSLAFLFAASSWCSDSIAQSCGVGFIQEGGQGYILCVPVESYYPPQNEPSTQTQTVSGPQWSTRWGAIAYDGKAGRFGGKEGFDNKRKAEKAAIKECKKNGGSACKIVTSYYNQCGAMAWGNNLMTASRGPDYDVTIQQAVTSCNKNSTNCQAYYAGCSLPVEIR